MHDSEKWRKKVKLKEKKRKYKMKEGKRNKM